MAKGRGGLGRGLESLFEDAAPSFESDTRIETLPLREVEPDPGQPRKTFDDETLAELSASIAEHGLLQTIAVRPKPSGGYLIVAGERRWRASRMAGLTEVPVIVKDVTDEQAMELALVENLQREDLDPVEDFLRHLDGIGDAVKQRQGVLILATFSIWVALSANGNVAHRRDSYDTRLACRFVELLAFLLKVERHVGRLSAYWPA